MTRANEVERTMKAHGVTQAKLGAAMGVHSSVISNALRNCETRSSGWWQGCLDRAREIAGGES